MVDRGSQRSSCLPSLTGTSLRGSTNCQERWFPPGQRLAPMSTLVGWSASTFTRNRSHLAQKEGVRSNVRAGIKTPLRFRASVGPRGGDAGSSEMEIRAITATIPPTNSGNRRNAEEAPVGPHKKNPKLVFARYGALSRRRRRREPEKVEPLLNRPRVTTNRGAGSVSWRGQL